MKPTTCPADAGQASDSKTEADRGKYPFRQPLDPFINRTASHRTASHRTAKSPYRQVTAPPSHRTAKSPHRQVTDRQVTAKLDRHGGVGHRDELTSLMPVI
jgi:hypothetical protein